MLTKANITVCKPNSDQRSPGPLKWPRAEHWQERKAKSEVKERGPFPESCCRTGAKDPAVRCLEESESQLPHGQAVLLHRRCSLKTRVPKDAGTQVGIAALRTLTRTGKHTTWHGQMNGERGEDPRYGTCQGQTKEAPDHIPRNPCTQRWP